MKCIAEYKIAYIMIRAESDPMQVKELMDGAHHNITVIKDESQHKNSPSSVCTAINTCERRLD